MKKIIIIMFLFIPMLSLHAQITKGNNFLGGSIGLWTKGNTPVLGASFESIITGNETGSLGIGGLFRYHGYNEVYNNGSYRDYNFTSLGFQANYNFTHIGTGEFAPYIGLTLGYNNVSNTYTNKNNVAVGTETYTSGAWIWGQLGARYFFSPNVAGNLRIGIGNNDFYPLEIGVDFKL